MAQNDFEWRMRECSQSSTPIMRTIATNSNRMKTDSQTLPVPQWVQVRNAGSLLILLVSLMTGRTLADGIPEPSLVMYGIITDSQGLRQTSGTLSITVTRPDGLPPLVLQTMVTNINDQFSYALAIPCESEVNGFPVTATDRLRLLPTPTTYNRAAVSFNGSPILYINSGQAGLTVSSSDRGRFERVDFSPLGSSALDTNGLLKSWELQYFGRLGIDPLADPDGDGMPNLDEMLAGTDPTNANSKLAFTSVTPVPEGGLQITWSSVAGRIYSIFRSGDLRDGFRPLTPSIPATAPVNTFTDRTAIGTGPFFYQIRLKTP